MRSYLADVIAIGIINLTVISINLMQYIKMPQSTALAFE